MLTTLRSFLLLRHVCRGIEYRMRRWAKLQAHFRRRRHAHVVALKRGRRMAELLAARKLQCRWAIKHVPKSTDRSNLPASSIQCDR